MKVTTSSIRNGWAKYLVLLVLAVCGLGGGLYLSSQPSNPSPTPSAEGTRSTAVTVHRYPLTTADVKDTLEAPVLSSDASGRVYLAWASRTGDNERTLFLTRSDDATRTFSTPKSIAKSGVFKSVSQMKGKSVTRELRMVPHLTTTNDTLQLAWTETLPGATGVQMVTTSSSDNGETIAAPMPVHHGPGARPTFTALTSSPDGSLLASWLDNRNKAQQCYAAIRRPGTVEFESESVVHAGDDEKGVCPCCPTASLLAPDGTMYVAFRNVANGYRDIAIGIRKPNSNTFALSTIVPPTWEFNGCPHDGPSLARVGEHLHIVWMDAHTGTPRCYHASAKLADMKFTVQELNANSPGSQGNAKLCADAKGTLHAVWEESLGTEPPAEGRHQHEPAAPTPGGGGGRVVMYRVWPVGATQFGEARAIRPVPGAFQTRPAICATPTGKVIVAWNELDENGKAVIVTSPGESGGM